MAESLIPSSRRSHFLGGWVPRRHLTGRSRENPFLSNPSRQKEVTPSGTVLAFMRWIREMADALEAERQRRRRELARLALKKANRTAGRQ